MSRLSRNLIFGENLYRVKVSVFSDASENDEQSMDEAGSLTDADENVSTEENGEEADEEIAIEEVAEVPQTVGQWSKSLDRTEPKLTIWNDDTKEGTSIQLKKETN